DTQVIGIAGGQSQWQKPLAGEIKLTAASKRKMKIMRVVQLLPVVLMAVVLTIMMAKWRVGRCVSAGREVRLASILRRGLAVVIDGVIIVTPFMLFSYAAIMELIESPFDFGLIFSFMLRVLCGGILWFPLMIFLFSLMEGLTGGTPGKWALGVRVLREDLTHCGLGRALLRNLLRIVDVWGWYIVGMLIAGLTQKRQRLGDLAAGTIVVLTPPRAPR
ncbi:hypothetical protein LCGC14_3138600, partial [marine sediment metagenome]